MEKRNTGTPSNGEKVEGERAVISDLTRALHASRALVPLILVCIGLMLSVGFLYFSTPFLLPVVLAVVLNLVLKPLVRLLGRIHLPQALAAFIVLGAFIAGLVFILMQLAQPARDWMATAPETLHKLELRLHSLTGPAAQLSKTAAQVEQMTQSGDTNAPVVTLKSTKVNDSVMGFTRTLVTGAVELFVLLYFLMAAGDSFLQKVVRVLPTLTDKKKAVGIAHEIQDSISAYLFTIATINAVLGAVIALAMMLIGMPAPLLWGVVAAILNFVPYFGPFAGVVALSMAGLTTFESMGHAFLPPIIYLIVHNLEANLFTPMILGKRLTLSPVVIFVSLMFWIWLWGIPGGLLAVPMLMILRILCDHIKPLGPIAELLGGSASKAEDVEETPPAAA